MGDIYTFDMGFGPSHQRIWQKFVDNITDKSMEKRFFNTIYEEVEDENGNKKQRHYIVAPTGLFAIFTIENEEVETTNYILKDHLGSINYIVDDEGNVEQELNFDAWGRRRNPATWQYYEPNVTLPTPMFERGYTMHEHLDAFKLINMNGRMYDPVVARFLSPDPIIQSPENSQSYNSYSYVFNNPLRYTDPSGFVANGDSTGNGGNTFGNTVINYIPSPNGGDGGASSFNTDDVQTGKSKLPIGVINPDLIEPGQSKLKRKTAGSVQQVGSTGGDVDNIYDDPESTIVTALSSTLTIISAVAKEIKKALAPIIGEHYGFKGAKYPSGIRLAGTFGTAGDFVSLAGAGNNILQNGGWNTENSVNFGITIVGFIPFYGDVGVLLYTGKQHQIKVMESRGLNPYSNPLSDFKCFAAGTKVTMGDMTYKNIENILVGDSVLTYNLKAKKLEVNVVQKIEDPIHHKLIEIAFRNGEKIISTEDHPYYVKGKGWCSFNPEQTQKSYSIEAGKLEVSDFCFTMKRNKLKRVQVIEIIQYEESIKTYNLSKISNSNNYFVNGVLVHNESEIK